MKSRGSGGSGFCSMGDLGLAVLGRKCGRCGGPVRGRSRRLGRTESCRSRGVNDGRRGCARRLKLAGWLVERGRDLAEGRRQVFKGVLVRTWALNAKMLRSLCCGLELDSRGRRCPVEFWRRGDFWRRKAKVEGGMDAGGLRRVLCDTMWGGLPGGEWTRRSHRQKALWCDFKWEQESGKRKLNSFEIISRSHT